MKHFTTLMAVMRGDFNFPQSKHLQSVVHNICYNIASLEICLYIYTLPLGRCVPLDLCLHRYQANPSRLCYKLYIFTLLDI